MYALLVRFTVLDEHLDDFDRLVEQTVAEIQAHEPETLIYVAHKVEGRSHHRYFYECYASRTAFDDHELSPYIQSFVEQRGYYLKEPVKVTELTPVAGVYGR